MFEDGYESDTSYNLRKAVLKREKSLEIKQARGQKISLVESFELQSLTEAYEERATRSAEMRAWKKTHQWMKEHPKRAAALGAGGVLMTASGVMTSTGVGIIPAATTSALGSALLDYGMTDESVPTTKKAINMGKAATLGAVPFLKFPQMMMASSSLALYGYSADDSMMKWGGGLTFAGGALVKGVQTLVKGATVVPSSSISHGVEALGLDVPKIHKNSRNYVGDTHVYAIRYPDRTVYKIGESAQGVNKLGQSKRAQQQVNKLERETGVKFYSEIRSHFPGKNAARTHESGLIQKHRQLFGSDQLPGNKGNR